MPTATTTPTTRNGWRRPHRRSPWRAIVTADSEADVLGKLLDAAKGGDRVVPASGENPNVKRKTGRY